MSNLDQFGDKIQRELSHRKQELSRLRVQIIDAPENAPGLGWMTRSAIVLAYAHWEGFVKQSSRAYVRVINSTNTRTSQLKSPLQAAMLVSHFRRGGESKKISFLGDLITEIDETRSTQFAVPPHKLIDTESNLSSVVFRENLARLALPELEFYATRSAFIDEKLVEGRNQVAHGELSQFKVEEVTERIDGVLRLLDTFADQLLDAVRDQSYRL